MTNPPTKVPNPTNTVDNACTLAQKNEFGADYGERDQPDGHADRQVAGAGLARAWQGLDAVASRVTKNGNFHYLKALVGP